MTRIVPAGNNKPDWEPQATKLQKTASDGTEVQDQEVDALYEAAKSVVEAETAEATETEVVEAATKCTDCDKDKSCKCKEGDECKCDVCRCTEKEDDVKEATACGAVADEEAVVLDIETTPDEGVVDEGVVDEGIGDVVNEVSEATSTEEKVEEAVEKIEEVVEDLKEAVGAEDAVDGEIGEGEATEEVALDIPGEEVVDSEVIVEGTPCGGEPCPSCGAMASSKPSMKKSASSEEFCKFAKLSPQNRQKLANYWTNMLGFPKEYVGLMTKDYEK